MNKRIAAALVVLLMGGSACMSIASAAESAGQDGGATVKDSEEAPPSPDAAETPQAGEDSNADLMKKFGRHRAGACPEGPPCKVED